MAIEAVGARIQGNVGLERGLSVRPRGEHDVDRSSSARAGAVEAPTVELSPERRLAAATRAVAASNHEAAASADFFASSQGTALLAASSTGSARGRLDVRM